MIHRPAATALHAARPALIVAWMLALMAAVIVCPQPAALIVLAAGLPLLAAAAHVARPVLVATAIGLPFAIVWALVNALLVRGGLTVLWTLGDWPLFGYVDITLEALVQGAVIALRGLVILQIGMLASAVLDPDRLVRSMQRVLPRGGLTGALALRFVPALVTDGRRYADGLRCRADDASLTPRGRALVVSATVGRAIDRADQVAAVLELRGLRDSGRLRRRHEAWSRHDAAVLAATLVIVGLAGGARAAGMLDATYLPAIEVSAPGPAALWAAAILLIAGAPLLGRKGVAR